MFQKILIANRGEIACRIIKTAHEMGIKTVAVYSDADISAKHVRDADEAVRIGPAPVNESYLVSDAIINAALSTGAEAIHPGYGFLSEAPDFAQAVTDAGLTFIGPSAQAIKSMGLKDAAKERMKEAGVPIVPGYFGIDQDPEMLAKKAQEIGYPVLIKARAGGGGKGMRLVEHPDEFQQNLASAQSEAKASFGDPICMIEKFIANPRHIEFQIMGDNFGNIVHLFERDCSLQRRHQKVIEEAPAPGMSEAMRAVMGQAAVNAARAISYSGAGTIEFIADGTKELSPDSFWFMEMNTRLQVEHPVTEAITGMDLVREQLSIASGAPLSVTQEQLSINGHSIEARIYAEDPFNEFLPAIGTLNEVSWPKASDFETVTLRIDSGVETGDVISPFYDPMIAKMIVTSHNRQASLAHVSNALCATRIEGCTTNLTFLNRLIEDSDFREGRFDTGLIAQKQDTLCTAPVASPLITSAAALAVLFKPQPPQLPAWQSPSRQSLWGNRKSYLTLLNHTKNFDCALKIDRQAMNLAVGGGEISIQDLVINGENIAFSADGTRCEFTLRHSETGVVIYDACDRFDFGVLNPLDRLTDEQGQNSGDLTSPMPGTVKEVMVKEGDKITLDQSLAVLEAMKMEHLIRAPFDGIIETVSVEQGSQVQANDLLIRVTGDEDSHKQQ